MSDEWSRAKEKQIERIKSMKPHDRLSLVEAITEINQYIASSCQGWMQWVYNPLIIGQFDQEKLQDIFETFRKFAIEFLEFDISATRGLGEVLKKQSKARRKEGPTYV
ncbi:MAG: DUF2153 family protein [Candidatus Bathyarchaeia archaeon]